MAANQINDI